VYYAWFQWIYRSSLLMQQDFSFGLVRFSLDLGAIMCVLTHFIALVPLIFLAILKLDSNILVLVITFLGVVSIPFLYLAWEISCPIYQVHTEYNLYFQAQTYCPISRSKKCTSKCHFGGTIEKVWGLARDWNLLI